MTLVSIATDRSRALSDAIRIEVLTLAWMVIEGAVSIYAGISSHSTSLVAFGADSLIELITAAFLLWRMQLERSLRSNRSAANAERIASWVAAIALAALCLYVVVESVYTLLHRGASESSPIGVALSIAAIGFMIPLIIKKRRLATALNSSALRADVACSLTCAYMAGALLVGLVMNALLHWWWLDSVVTLAFLYWLIPETREAFEGARRGELSCECDEC